MFSVLLLFATENDLVIRIRITDLILVLCFALHSIYYTVRKNVVACHTLAKDFQNFWPGPNCQFALEI